MKPCAVCRQPACEEIINFGAQAICHHFIKEGEQEDTHPLALGQCSNCGLVQMMEPIPPRKLVPRFEWITYNEPEAHLDEVVAMLQTLPGLTPSSLIAGVSFNDDSTLRRFRERGFGNTVRPDMATDLGIKTPNAGVETVQDCFKPSLAPQLRQKFGTPDLVVSRMILEHTSETFVFLKTLREWVNPSGYVVFDVPDCSRAFDLLDYTTLWEDHTLYFVEQTFLAALRLSGFHIERFECYKGAYENCLVAVAKPSNTVPSLVSPNEVAVELKRTAKFASEFKARKATWKSALEAWKKRGKIGLFGAGHQSVMFLNLMEVGGLIDFVLDDHPHKCGRKMPGSRLPIVGSSSLYSENVKICLSSLGAASEPKVIKKHEQFVQQGGVFASIFPIKRDSILNILAGNMPD